MTRLSGTFTTLRRELAPMDWSEIVELVSNYARSQGLRWTTRRVNSPRMHATRQTERKPEAMTNDTTDTTGADTFEKWIGPVRTVIRKGGRKIPMAPPLAGETGPFAWTTEPDEVVSMDVDGRHVESVTASVEQGLGRLLVKFKDGGEATYDAGAVRSTHDR